MWSSRTFPPADIVMDGYWEKLFWKDCVLENISGPAIQISREDNSCTQINLRNLWCSNVPPAPAGPGERPSDPGSSGAYLLHSLFHGDDLTLGQQEPERKTLVELEPLPEAPPFPPGDPGPAAPGDLAQCAGLRRVGKWCGR